MQDSINFHLLRACNARCVFCYASFEDVPQTRLPTVHALELLATLRTNRPQKVNFAGGEPTLHPGLSEMTLLRETSGLHHIDR